MTARLAAAAAAVLAAVAVMWAAGHLAPQPGTGWPARILGPAPAAPPAAGCSVLPWGPCPVPQPAQTIGR